MLFSYIMFLCHHLFSLLYHYVYLKANIKEYMDRITMGMLSMVRGLGTLPVIRAPPGGEMCAQGLYSALSENLTPRGPAYSLFSECLVSSSSGDYGNSSSGSDVSARPLLLIFDRYVYLSIIL